MLEFQARQTRSAARLALAYPGEGAWAEYALHGFRYLRDRMWDADGGGGWYWLLDHEGNPMAGHSKHAHAGSYAVQASALVHRATGDQGALELALAGFEWFERHGVDREHGGYHSWFRRDGSPILTSEQRPTGMPDEDPLGHAVGLKNINVQGDWFEALFELRAVSDDARVVQRLESLAQLCLNTLTTADGRTHFAFEPDWTLVPGPEQYGYNFQECHRLFDAAPLFPNLPLAERARAVLVHGLKAGHRRGGGYAFEESSGSKSVARRARYGPGRRAWWVQFEVLRCLARFALSGDSQRATFERLLLRHWRFVESSHFDARYGGVWGTATADLVPWDRPFSPLAGRYLKKGDPWKDASHDTDSLLECIRLLSGVSLPL